MTELERQLVVAERNVWRQRLAIARLQRDMQIERIAELERKLHEIHQTS